MTTKEYNNSVDLYADGLFRFAFKSLRDEELARDVVQESFMKLWVKLDTVDAQKVKSYLFTAVYHSIVDQSRKLQRNREFESQIKPSFYEDQTNFDLQQQLHDALNRLPEIQKTVVLLRDYEGYSYEEIGEIAGLSEQQVKVYIFRARKALKEYLVDIENLVG
jgi:RNA polymerase sigma-70 factor (ECF subfamily)